MLPVTANVKYVSRTSIYQIATVPFLGMRELLGLIAKLDIVYFVCFWHEVSMFRER